MSDSTEVLKGELKSAQEEIERLHAACEKRGFNSRETKDIFGRTFPLPVDAEHVFVEETSLAAAPAVPLDRLAARLDRRLDHLGVHVHEVLDTPEGIWPVFGLCIGRPAQSPESRPRLDTDAVLFDESYPTDESMLAFIDEFTRFDDLDNYHMDD